ncbi:energy-coupling factor transporter transmembrane protein EcfT [Hoyosella rhizosphaerae]|uniref:Energy-coupling factor transporter transmembrane protein EcfT n=1 Tax=Hoyosella rhizosphaerae TaxID=1755582 RepID=A0A916U3U0_9ACTN|nr:energy-coupling factor transporter transmembrane component T [Hoyosella rhizosphaerae]MBN4926535.1 energy-coupling factor transporter transmembrane protein EcfT [Hoyosella rhizosphaerae]GGC58509.1 energy-coupling factor transporter transmembrane protein EcfT [Hoyosella rhizosphaerae]
MRLYDPSDSWLHRRNPLTLLTVAVCLAILVFTVPVWWWLCPVLLGLLLLMATLNNRRTIFSVWLVMMLPFAALSFLLQGLFFPEALTSMWEFGPARVTSDGLQLAALITLRVGSAIAGFLIFLAATFPPTLMNSLTHVGVHPKISFIVMSGVTLIPTFHSKANMVLLAQQARGVATQGSWLYRMKVLITVVKPVTLTVLSQVGDRAFALEQRGFGSTVRPTIYRPVNFPRTEKAACVALIVITVSTALLLVAVQ